MFGELVFYRQNYEVFPQEADIFHTNKDYAAENQFSVKTILTKNFEPSVLHHHSELNLEVAWYSVQAIPSEFASTSLYRPANKSEEYNVQ